MHFAFVLMPFDTEFDDETKYVAKATLTSTVDLENTSLDRSINIRAIYFYKENPWQLLQDDGKDSASSAVDAEFLALRFKK